MTREQELKEIIFTLYQHIGEATCGIFNSRNLAGDPMTSLFKGEYFTMDICYPWYYVEVFGCTDHEWNQIREVYKGFLKLERLKEEDDLK